MNDKYSADPFDYSKVPDDYPNKPYLRLISETLSENPNGWYIDYCNYFFVIIALPFSKGGNRMVLDFFDNERGYSVNSAEGLSQEGFVDELKRAMAHEEAHPMVSLPKPKIVYEQMSLF